MKKINLALAALALNIGCGSVVSYAEDMNMMMKDKCMMAKTEDQCNMVMLDKTKDMSMINMMMKQDMMVMYDENGMVKMMDKNKKAMMLCTWTDNMCSPTMMMK